MREDLARPVEPDRDSLFFYALLRLGPERFFWYVRYHHICMDGFGGALIPKRTAEIYSALVQTEPRAAVPLSSPLSICLMKKEISPHGAQPGSRVLAGSPEWPP